MSGQPLTNRAGADVLEQARIALLAADEPERYRLLAALLNDLAERGAGTNGKRESAEQLEALGKRLTRLNEEKATLTDALAQARADLTAQGKQVEVERTRCEELQKIITDQRVRLDAAQKEASDLEAQLIARNSELHKLEVEKDQYQLKAQRAELAAGDMSKIDAFNEDKRKLGEQIRALQADLEQLRTDKDAEIAQLKSGLAGSQARSEQSADALLLALWQRLAHADPPLGPGHLQPTVQSAERLFDAFIELTRFAKDFDLSIRPFLGSYTKYNPAVKRPWDVYAKYADLDEAVKETIAIQGGKPVGVLKMRLRALKTWTMAGIIGCDSAIESIASALQEHLMSPYGAGTDINAKIRDFLKRDGHLLFSELIRELRSRRLAEAYGHGV